MVFYGVYDPTAGGEINENARSTTVFDQITDAISMIKNRKEARMRSFANRQDAIDFSQTGITRLPSQSSNSVHKPLQQQDQHQQPPTDLEISADQSPRVNGEASLTICVKSPPPPPTTPASDKPAFRSLKSQELVLFRKMIEQGKLDAVADAAWKNPRYLIGSGDTPSILKESSRYNALHVAALAKNALMCEKLLDIISNVEFIQLVYGKKNVQYCQETSGILQDLYLNMPERGRNETPLHLAVKFGAVEVVETLTSYPQCNQTRNSDGCLPIDIICSRIERVPSVVQHIRELLSGRFYVPVIRSVDNSLPPTIGEPFSPKNPPKLVFDPLSPEMEIQAYAGPMNQDEAQVFRRRWKTPPRITSAASCTSPPPNLSPQQQQHTSSIELTPKRLPSRQLFPRQLMHTTPTRPTQPHPASTPIKPPMLSYVEEPPIEIGFNDSPLEDPPLVALDDSMVTEEVSEIGKSNLSSAYRTTKNSLDDSLMSNASFADSPSFMERNTKLIDSQKGLEMIGRQLATERNIKWREYWPFLDCFVDIRSGDGLNRLEECLRTNAESRRKKANSKESIGLLCDALNSFHVGTPSASGGPPVLACNPRTGRIGMATPSISAYSAYLYTEKSWQVYARRLTNTISASATASTEGEAHIREGLLAELRRLTALVVSYQNDVKFSAVEFGHGHSRFAHLIAGYLILDHGMALDEIRTKLQRILSTVESLAASPIRCVLRHIMRHLANPSQMVQPNPRLMEEDARRLWTAEDRCLCGWQRVQPTTGSQVGRKRVTRRNDVSHDSASTTRTTTTTSTTTTDEDRSPVEVDNWTSQRATSRRWSSSSSSSSSSDDDDMYFSANSNDDEFDTPPDSPSGFESPAPVDFKFRNYVMGEQPTKADGDAFNALSCVDIDRATHPHVFEWYQAMQQFQYNERSAFPSMTPLPWLTKNRCRTDSKSRMGSAKISKQHQPLTQQPPPAWSLLRRIQVDRAWRFGGHGRLQATS